jgi:signal transduction histidine kinase
MSFLEILKLVGFATGAVLHLYIGWLIWKRPRYQDRTSERAFVLLALCLGSWFLGNLLGMLQQLLLGTERLTSTLRVWDTIAVIGIALFPSALLHCHVAFWSWMDGYNVLSARRARLVAALFYIPMAVLPYTVYRVNTGDYRPYLLKLVPVLLPYSIWFVLATWSAALLDWTMKDRLRPSAARERAFLKRVALLLFLNGAFEFLVEGLGGQSPRDYLWVAYILLSLLPTFTVAYYIYRYHLYELVIKGSLVYAIFAVLFLAVYTFGIRHLDSFLVSRFEIHPGVVEAILVLCMFAIAGPLVRLLDRLVLRLFAREIATYRDVVMRVSALSPKQERLAATVHMPSPDLHAGTTELRAQAVGGATLSDSTKSAVGLGFPLDEISDLGSLVASAEETIRERLALARVKIVLCDRLRKEGPESRLAEKLKKWPADLIELDDDLASLGASAVYPLKRANRLVGEMIIFSEPGTLTLEKRAVLEVLAAQVAIGIESCLLSDQKLRLERELAGRRRLAALGQMAASIAHEVKNPLSSIKAIAQVMREDHHLSGYDKDLDLIVGEIDRLSRTVSQLLSFSRPGNGPPAAGMTELHELIDRTVSLLGGESESRHVHIESKIEGRREISGFQAEAVREVVTNLLLNAVQSAPEGGCVTLEVGILDELSAGYPKGLQAEPPKPAEPYEGTDVASGSPSARVGQAVRIAVADDGPGIPLQSQSRVFEPFYTTRAGGTGLGLAIVQRRVSDLGGSIELTSPLAQGHGAKFTVRFRI